MKKRMLAYMIVLLCCIPAAGQSDACTYHPRFTFGAEWAYTATFLTARHDYFFAPEGFREEIRSTDLSYYTNGDVYFHAGYNFNPHWNLSLYIGYTVLADYHAAVPISVRATRYFGPAPLKDRWFAFCDVGSGISIKEDPQEIVSGKIGGGYRLSLSRFTKLDFICSVKGVYTHPDIGYYNEKIDKRFINRNDGLVLGLSLGLSLSF